MPYQDRAIAKELEELERIWARLEAPCLGTLGPGAHRPEIHAAFDAVGLAPLPELVSWYEWHDGGAPAPFNFASFSLQEAIHWWHVSRDILETEDRRPALWRPSLWPLGRKMHPSSVYVECGHGDSRGVVFWVDWDGDDTAPVPVVGSLAEMAAAGVTALERGAPEFPRPDYTTLGTPDRLEGWVRQALRI